MRLDIVDRSVPRRSAGVQSVRAAVAFVLGEGDPTLAAVASYLGLSTRTLQRRLADSGETFRGILDDVRRTVALAHITDDGVTITELGARLGYASPGAFNRAFRRWTGDSPGRYRSRRRL